MNKAGKLSVISLALLALIALSCGTTYETGGLSMQELEAMAEETYADGDYDGASQLYTELMFMYPGAANTDLYYYMLGLSEQGQRYWADAVFYFSRVWTEFPRSQWADDASFQAARTWWLQKHDYRKDLTPVLNAVAQLDLFFASYPGSPLGEEAEILLDDLHDQLALRALFVGRFYARREEYDAALLYLREGLNDYGDPLCKADILMTLSGVYESMGNLYSARRSLERALDECELDPERLADITEALERL